MNVIPQLFTYDEVKKFYPNVKNFYAFACRASKKGQIKQIKKGLYALVDPSTGGIYSTRFQIASHLFNDSYFSYHEGRLEVDGLLRSLHVCGGLVRFPAGLSDWQGTGLLNLPWGIEGSIPYVYIYCRLSHCRGPVLRCAPCLSQSARWQGGLLRGRRLRMLQRLPRNGQKIDYDTKRRGSAPFGAGNLSFCDCNLVNLQFLR